VSAARTLQDRVAALLAAGVEDRPARVPTAIFG
jgi:hypothetical protein